MAYLALCLHPPAKRLGLCLLDLPHVCKQTKTRWSSGSNISNVTYVTSQRAACQTLMFQHRLSGILGKKKRAMDFLFLCSSLTAWRNLFLLENIVKVS